MVTNVILTFFKHFVLEIVRNAITIIKIHYAEDRKTSILKYFDEGSNARYDNSLLIRKKCPQNKRYGRV